MANVGFATLSVIPSLKGIDKKMGGELSGPLSRAGANAGDQASRSFGSRFSKGLKVASLAGGAALAGGLGAAFAILKTGGQEASDASAGIAQLGAGIKSTGNKARVSIPGLEALASSIEGFSGQTDDSIVASENLLLTFTNIRNAAGKGNDIFNQATLATANLAAKMGGDAAGSAIQLGKALNDPVKGITALTRVGVSFTQGQKDQIKALVATGDTMGAQKIILKELNTEFGGAAKAAGQSIPGQLARAKRAFEGLSQGIVETLLPVAMPAIAALSSGLKKLAPIAQNAVKGLTATASLGVGALFKAFKDGDVTSDGFVGVMERIGVALRSIIPAVKSTVAGVLPALQQFVGQAVDLFVNHLIPLFVNFARVVLPVVIDIGKNLASIFTGSIVPAFAEVVDFTSAHVIPVVKRVADVFSAFLGFLAEHQGPVKTFAKVVLGLLVARFAALKINAAVVGIQKFVGTIRANIKSVVDFGKSVASIATKMASFAKSTLLAAANVAKTVVVFVAQKVAMLASAVATKALAAATWLLDAAMSANPVVLLVAGIAALAVGVVLAYKKFKPFRDIVDAVGRAFRSVFNWVKSNWPVLLAILTGPIGLAVLAFKRFGPQILSAITGAFGAVSRFFSELPGKIVSALGAIGSLLVDIGKRIVGGLIDGARFALGVYLAFYVKLPLAILGKLKAAGTWLVSIGAKVLGGLLKGAVNGQVAVLQFFAGLALRVLRKLGAVGSWLLDAGRQVMSGLLRGVVNGAVGVFLFFVGLPAQILRGFRRIGSLLVNSGRALLLGLGNGVIEGAGLVLGWLGGLKDRVLGAIGDARNWLFDVGHNVIGGLLDGIKDALGGVKDFLGGVGGKIVSWKGPPAKDAKLLIPTGGIIMEGLVKGVAAELPALQKQLGVVSDQFAKSFARGNLDFGLPKVVGPVKSTPFSPQSVRQTIQHAVDLDTFQRAGATAEGFGNTYILQVDTLNGPEHLRTFVRKEAVEGFRELTRRNAFVRGARTG